MQVRSNFEAEIQQLKAELITLSETVEKQIINTVDALIKRDLDASKKIKQIDSKVNTMRFKIEEQVLVTIATQQPLAHDLRLLASILEIAGELERIGDYAKGISTINLRMGEEELLAPYDNIPPMAEKVVNMLHRSIDAFINENVEDARRIPSEDDAVDELYTKIYHEMIAIVIKDGNTIEKTNWLIWTAHNLERMADRVTNICERTIFTVTGVLREIRSTDQ